MVQPSLPGAPAPSPLPTWAPLAVLLLVVMAVVGLGVWGASTVVWSFITATHRLADAIDALAAAQQHLGQLAHLGQQPQGGTQVLLEATHKLSDAVGALVAAQQQLGGHTGAAFEQPMSSCDAVF